MLVYILLAVFGILGYCADEEGKASLSLIDSQQRSPETQASTGSCGYFYGASAYYSSDCTIYICGPGTITFSTCSSYGGSYSGDPKLLLYDSSNILLNSNDDYCSLGPQLSYTFSSSSCAYYYLRATCFSYYYSCSQTPYYYYSGSVTPVVTNSLSAGTIPSTSTSRAPSRSPSRAPTRIPGSVALATFKSSYYATSTASLTLCGAGTIIISSCSPYGGSSSGYVYFQLYDDSYNTIASDSSYYCSPGSQISYVKSTSTCDTFIFSSACYSSSCTTAVAYLFTGTSASVYSYPTSAPASSPTSSTSSTIAIVVSVVVIVIVGCCAVCGICFCIARRKADAVRPQLSFAPTTVPASSQPGVANHQQMMAHYASQQQQVYGASSPQVQQVQMQPQVAVAQPYGPVPAYSAYGQQQPPPMAEVVPVPYSPQPVMGGSSAPYPSGLQMTTFSTNAQPPMTAPPAVYNFTVDHTNSNAAVVIHHEAVPK